MKYEVWIDAYVDDGKIIEDEFRCYAVVVESNGTFDDIMRKALAIAPSPFRDTRHCIAHFFEVSNETRAEEIPPFRG